MPTAIAEFIPALNAKSLWLVALGWFLAGAGAFSVLSDFVDWPVKASSPNVPYDLAVNVSFGVLAGLACILIHKAGELFKAAGDRPNKTLEGSGVHRPAAKSA
ncbi:hypothetical protein EOW77_0005355 [Bradyrhizobium yuanmingense]|uniref:hypothetical protein n=1 Tax=Bradyrhizobium yuanmingense TaxID=108015 RepID=UPI000FE29FF5|nr:hypothetical protein [Bradyrhizobium yuanmingense]TGN89735.1 hypothetical protein EOW77_0005355 [Bradyrhizobium yuanmingense]